MADFQYDPVEGWNNETEFPDYPQASEVRPLFQKLFDQIRDAFNTHKAEDATSEVKGHVQLATNAEVTAGTDTSKAVTPAGAKVELDKKMNAISPASNADPNTTQDTYILTNNANGPDTGASYWHILTMFYSSRTGNRAQIAVRYNGVYNAIYIRAYYNPTWTAWTKLVNASGDTMSGELNMADQLLTRAYIKDYAEVIGTTPATTGTINFDMITGNKFKLTPTGAVTIGFVNWPANGRAGSVTVTLKNGATVYAKTFTAAIKWVGDAIPDLSEANKSYDLVFSTDDAGTTIHGACIGPYSA
jgi:hypothetical protein